MCANIVFGMKLDEINEFFQDFKEQVLVLKWEKVDDFFDDYNHFFNKQYSSSERTL